MATSPRITVAIPTFNRPALLERCLTTLLSQIDASTEIYVSDNASDNETSLVMAKFNDPRLTKSRNTKNIGLFPNLNHCLSRAAGEFIIFLSDDDFIDDDLLPSCLDLLQLEDADVRSVAVMAANRYLTTTEDGESVFSEVESQLPTGFYDGDFLLQQFWLERISFQLCGILFRTEALRSIGGFTTEHRYCGDVLTFASLFLNHQVGFISSPKCTYVIHADSESTALGHRYRLQDTASVFDKIKAKGRRELPRDRGRRLAASARHYMTIKYLRSVLDLRRAGASRSQCVAAFLPVFGWMLGHGGEPLRTSAVFIFEILLPLRLKELFWTSQRFWRRITARGLMT